MVPEAEEEVSGRVNLRFLRGKEPRRQISSSEWFLGSILLETMPIDPVVFILLPARWRSFWLVCGNVTRAQRTEEILESSFRKGLWTAGRRKDRSTL